jgi:hypothetical protein
MQPAISAAFENLDNFIITSSNKVRVRVHGAQFFT